MDIELFKKEAHALVEWIADYYREIEKYPVKSQVKPKEIFNQLPVSPPQKSEAIPAIMEDFQKIIMPGITHWQSPNFFAYFPANSSYPSVLAEMLTAALGAQCMIWETSPAAAELEEKVMNWLKQMMGLPESWYGVIQDTASSATLCAILSAREKATNYETNNNGFSQNNFRVYGSTQTHSSIDKAVKIAGIGKNNLIKVAVDENLALDPDALEKAIKTDLLNGKKPLCVIATIGTTGTTAIDPIKEIAAVCKKYDIWLHVDAAFAGTALILPEMHYMADGLDMVDSYVFNPHKWMFTNFDCSAYYVKDKETLIRTFEIMPEYLKTAVDSQVNNYRDWGIALGRRFRALKLWFVIRSFGVDGIRERIRNHIKMAQELVKKMKEHGSFEILAPVPLNVICFRFKPKNMSDENELNKLNENLLKQLNAGGKIYMTHTKIDGKYTIRMVIGQTYVQQKHVDVAWELIQETAKNLKK
ncbi:MAG: aminotransferase class I/II-fold pyridoxal phosphate-dependent enzyme [Calditrichaeota bacterium]|nr:aminotransferase class I/II-fold pyridoxal phosphate-dependent enzyme [Calditrichota bacterium]